MRPPQQPEHLEEGEAVRSPSQRSPGHQAAGYNAPRIFSSCQYLISADRLTLKSHTWAGLPLQGKGGVRRSGWPGSSHLGRDAAHGPLPPPSALPPLRSQGEGRVCLSGGIWVPVGAGTARPSSHQQPRLGRGDPAHFREQVSVCDYLCAFRGPALYRLFTASATEPGVCSALRVSLRFTASGARFHLMVLSRDLSGWE